MNDFFWLLWAVALNVIGHDAEWIVELLKDND